MTEQVKVIHVVGQTTRPMQKNRMMIHHSIGFSPDHQVFNHASKSFRVAAAELKEKDSAPAEIDVRSTYPYPTHLLTILASYPRMLSEVRSSLYLLSP